MLLFVHIFIGLVNAPYQQHPIPLDVLAQGIFVFPWKVLGEIIEVQNQLVSILVHWELMVQSH